jgi:hypothetical protein
VSATLPFGEGFIQILIDLRLSIGVGFLVRGGIHFFLGNAQTLIDRDDDKLLSCRPQQRHSAERQCQQRDDHAAGQQRHQQLTRREVRQRPAEVPYQQRYDHQQRGNPPRMDQFQ